MMRLEYQKGLFCTNLQYLLEAIFLLLCFRSLRLSIYFTPLKQGVPKKCALFKMAIILDKWHVETWNFYTT